MEPEHKGNGDHRASNFRSRVFFVIIPVFNTILILLLLAFQGFRWLPLFTEGFKVSSDEKKFQVRHSSRVFPFSYGDETVIVKRDQMKKGAAAGSSVKESLPLKRGVIVFIHGLNADNWNTWQEIREDGAKVQADSFWPRLLANDPALSQYDISLMSYPSHFFAPEHALEEVVDSLQFHLDQKWNHEFHIVVIAHSMGGLIAREAISRSAFNERPWQTLTLISLASPFRGASLADLVDKLEIEGAHVNYLTTGQSLKRALSVVDWSNFRKKCGARLFHYAGYETVDFPDVNELIVERESATALADFSQGFSDDHNSIARPTDHDDPINVAVREWIQQRELGREPKAVAGEGMERTTRLVFPTVPFESVQDPDNPRIFTLGPGDIEIFQNIQIPFGVTLIIQPGTKLIFHQNTILHSEGRIHAEAQLPVKPKDRDFEEWMEHCEEEKLWEPIVFDFSQSKDSPEQRRFDAAVYLSGQGAGNSVFHGCVFFGGGGIALDKPNPRTHQDWPRSEFANRAIRIRTPDATDSGEFSNKLDYGGALCLAGVSNVEISNCRFLENQAHQGGALFCLASERISLKRSVFEGNVSNFGGGAVFLQISESYFDEVIFRNNRTGQSFSKKGSLYACGGAVYMGGAFIDCRKCVFKENASEHLGGAIYMLSAENMNSAFKTESIMTQSRFLHNRSKSVGGALCVDPGARLLLGNCLFESNRAGQGSMAGQAAFHQEVEAITWTDTSRFVNNGVANREADFYQQAIGQGAPAAPYQIRMDWPLNNASPRPEKKREPSAVTTAVIHPLASWETAQLRDEFVKKEIAPHFLIDRHGVVLRFVDEMHEVNHTVEPSEKTPAGGRSPELNSVSLGIAMIADSDQTRRRGVLGFNPLQYAALRLLLNDLGKELPKLRKVWFRVGGTAHFPMPEKPVSFDPDELPSTFDFRFFPKEP